MLFLILTPWNKFSINSQDTQTEFIIFLWFCITNDGESVATKREYEIKDEKDGSIKIKILVILLSFAVYLLSFGLFNYFLSNKTRTNYIKPYVQNPSMELGDKKNVIDQQ